MEPDISAEFQPPALQSFGLFKNNGASVLQVESLLSQSKQTPASTGASALFTGTHDACPQQRFHTLTLDELSEELDRRTKETQRLQEEVEYATKVTLERFGCTYGIHSSPGQRYHNHSFNVHDSPGDSSIPSTHQQAVTQPLVCGLGSLSQTGAQRDICSPREEVFENVIDDCLQQLSDLQLNKTPDPPKQETFSVDKAVVNLQTKLHRVQLERDVQSDLRLKDSRTHVFQMEKMLHMLEELQKIKRAGDQKLQETEEETLALNEKVATLERNVKEMYDAILSNDKQRGQDTIKSPDTAFVSSQLNQAADLTEYLNNVTNKLQERPFLTQEHLGSEESRGANKPKERIEDLIAGLGQEMVLLTDKLSSSKHDSISLSVKLEMLKGLAERQTSLHQCQVCDLESAICSHKDKVCCLEQQLVQAQSQLVDAQRERERSLLQAEELQSQICQLQRCGDQQQCELQEEVKVLRGQLEAAREQLRRGGEEKSCLEALLEQRAQEGRKSQELLREKTKELQHRQQESQQYLVRLDVAQRQCQILQAEEQTLRLQLDDRERMLDDLRLEMESSIQMSVQHSRAINNLHQENSLLSNQLNQHKQEMEQRRAELEQNKLDLAAADQERRRLQVSVEEQRQRVQEETLKKQQLTSQLEVQHMQFLTLTEEHQQLQQLHICKSEEHEGVALKLQSQLRNTHKELDQVRSTLRTLEGADGHGLQVAMEMQRKITVRREQFDSLQSKIQHSEETIEKLHQEKRQQSLQHQQQLQELTFIREEKRQLRSELEALHSNDKQLRERIGRLEAILHKMSESFADCQDFIQLQEQDFIRLKIQHTLDLKELQGQNFIANVPPSDPDSPSSSALTAPPSSQQAFNTHITQKEIPVREFRSLVKDLRGVISENHRPHTEHTATRSSFLRRRSAPEKEHTTTSSDKDKAVRASSRLRRKTCGSEPHVLKTAEQNGKTVNYKSFRESCGISSPAAAGKYSSSSQLLSLGRRSPVHSLLTSDPNSHQ
ncbi:coiled-coil domain-containing protein 158-like isoform X2 [Notolabrus celidotus]|uniref:coiled-coil domain-containing protein 158-like isoform X2 n=1 Tax=Notolabrus celidotus TaxID=1203425 RepID=UPI00148F6FB9|nr:coiled-coil domain-containing protein 158-like isoform X2 [Notolabrus celidotus]